MLTIALPKGRVANDSFKLFESVFGKSFGFKDRKLILNVDDFKFLSIRGSDIPLYVYHGIADLGIVGLDVLEEHDIDVIRLLNLNIGKCCICIGFKKGEASNLNKPYLKVATKNVNIAKRYFDSKNIPAQIIKLSGSIELAPMLGLCDIVVDIVETGNTMRENGLEIGDSIMACSAYLIANKNSYLYKKEDILSLYEKLKVATI